jgi:riboflavin synthase
MFTGIIEALGTITEIVGVDQGIRLEVAADGLIVDLKVGDSVAVNGVCLTVVGIEGSRAMFDVSAETLSRTSLSELCRGTAVNLERPLTLSALLGGHLVQGHVDATGRFEQVTPSGDGFLVRITFPVQISRYIVEKGSIAVDGISLTVASLGEDWFEIAIIPHTWRVTNLSTLPIGARLNLEVDVIAKYVEKLMSRQQV